MAESHPASFGERGADGFSQLARNTVASFALIACLVSLGIILNNQYGARFGSAVMHGLGTIDFTPTAVSERASDPVAEVVDPNEGRYRSLGEYLARRYRVSSEMTTDIVAKAHAAGSELRIDPVLILAVISVESRFNPIAESVMGAKGLMQVIPRFHVEKFNALGGERVVFDPAANIMVGAKILKEYIRRTGDVADGLQMYVGGISDDGENSYSAKVMAERDRLQSVLRQYLARQRTSQPNSAAKRPGAAI